MAGDSLDLAPHPACIFLAGDSCLCHESRHCPSRQRYEALFQNKYSEFVNLPKK